MFISKQKIADIFTSISELEEYMQQTEVKLGVLSNKVTSLTQEPPETKGILYGIGHLDPATNEPPKVEYPYVSWWKIEGQWIIGYDKYDKSIVCSPNNAVVSATIEKVTHESIS